MTIEIVDLPINNGDFPSFFVDVYQGVVMFTNVGYRWVAPALEGLVTEHHRA